MVGRFYSRLSSRGWSEAAGKAREWEEEGGREMEGSGEMR